jgi:hypothetical protein
MLKAKHFCPKRHYNAYAKVLARVIVAAVQNA